MANRELSGDGDESPDAPLLAGVAPDIAPVKKNSFRQGLPSISQIGYYVTASKNEAKRRPMNFCLGCCGCLMVVFISALLISVLSRAPVIFARLSELEVGETDVILSSDTGLSLNYTQIQRALRMQNLDFPSSPRSRLIVQLYDPRNCFHTNRSIDFNVTDYLWNCTDNPECFAMSCSQNELGVLVLIDSAKEVEIGIGSAWPHPPLSGNNINLQKSLAQYLGVKAGDQVILMLQLSQYYGRAYQQLVDSYWATLRLACRTNSSDRSCSLLKQETARRRVWPLVYLALNVSVVYSDILGKHSSEQEDTVLMDMASFSSLIAHSLHPDIPPEIRSVLLATVPFDHVQSVIFNLPQPRQLVYAQSDFGRVRDRVTAYAGQISYAVGFSLQSCDVPVLESLEGKAEMSVLLRLVLNIIVLSLVVLSSLLIHSLLAVSVDTRTFELGVLRMIGMRRTGVVLLVLTQAVSYAVPALIIGLGVASLLGIYMADYFHSLTAIRLSPRLSFEGVCTAIVLATAVPLFSALGPVMGALSNNVADSAASRRPPGPTMRKYVLTRSEESIDSTPLLVGGLCTVLGFLIYFGLPYSLVSVNLSLLFNILFGLLMCMLLGLVLLTLNVEHLTERIVLAMFFFWERATVRSVIQKNLTAHRIRNRKTTIVYSLSLSFILFVSVSYSTQISALYYSRQKSDGAFVRIDAAISSVVTARASSYQGFTPAVMERLEQFATAHAKHIGGYGWRAKMTTRGDTKISNLGHSFSEDGQLYGTSPDLLDGFISGFLDVESGPSRFTEALYQPQGSGACALSTSAKDTIGAKIGEPFILTLVERLENNTVDHMRALKPLALVSACASFAFSSYPNRPDTAVVTSFTTLAKLLPGVQSVDEIPMTSFYIDIDPYTLPKPIYTSLMSELYEIVRRAPGLYLSEYAKRGQLIKMINLAMGFFFNFATVCAMAVCFFSLMSSMYTNIHEQTHEIAILQALGLPVSWLRRIYIFEAFVLIVTASLMGIAVGTAVAWSLVLQQVMLLDIPLPFSFPWSTLGAVFVSAILFAVMASLGPTNTVVRRPIVENLRFVG